jgi:hypothetical protein
MKIINKTLVIVAFILINSCITPFEPEGVAQIDNMVVIEGNIIQNDTTKVIISRSLALNDENKINYISKASVWVESETGIRYTGKEVKKGVKIQYNVITQGINPALKYKICAVISNKRYESDLVSILSTPPIDSIGFTPDYERKSVTFYVNTQDPENKTRYYKWSYTEDWEFHSEYLAVSEYNPTTKKIFDIEMSQNRHFCWGSSVSSAILIQSTDHLTQDKVFQKKLTSMSSKEKKISYLYSMELTQMAITQDAYKYWENIRKNSDEIGGIFAPQPSEIKGNLKCISNPSEKVLGFISGAVVSKKRVFVWGEDIDIYEPPGNCEVISVGPDNPMDIEELYLGGYDVISYFQDTNESVWVTKTCVDCRLWGTKKKPAFWPTSHI